jgi:hypothetical protein
MNDAMHIGLQRHVSGLLTLQCGIIATSRPEPYVAPMGWNTFLIVLNFACVAAFMFAVW